MRQLWSEVDKRRTWRRVWHALAAAQAARGLVTPQQLEDVVRHLDDVDVAEAERIEAEIKHDLVAELRVFAAQCDAEGHGAGGILHVGATSMDIEDNADVLRMKDALGLVRARLHALIRVVAARVEATADVATMGMTHIQPAEPTTLGYRLAQLGQDLVEDCKDLAAVARELRGKGMKGACGTSASYVELTGSVAAAQALEADVLAHLGLDAFPVATQTYPRKQDLRVVSALASLGQSLYKFAFDLRILQTPAIGELAEPFGKHQVGSSAMPFKRNPVAAENVCSLARQLAALPRLAWDNAAHSLLERTLDDSANRRSLLPEAFLLADALLVRSHAILEGLVHDPAASERLLVTYGPFAATERVLMEAVKAGGDRQALHEVLREHTLAAWPEVQAGRPSDLALRLAGDPRITLWLEPAQVAGLMDARAHVGDAPQRARAFAAYARDLVTRFEEESPA
ncbi:MAG: adenylosuccinate lyase [Deltaproteobacteria bacterium]|nr:adenylosuccinate lyase [Deltaproteobacteria bacterium]